VNALEGIVIVDKPAGWTSHDVVSRMRRLAGTRRVGHAGTLDPMATGVLVVGIGRATRLLGHISGSDKTYAATIRLGWATVTDDMEGERLGGASADGLSAADLAPVIAALTGPIMQRPSSVSAIKVEGRRSHDRVRAGEDVELPARPVVVGTFDRSMLSGRWTWTWWSPARRERTSVRWRATLGRRSESGVISPRCAEPGSGASTSLGRAPSSCWPGTDLRCSTWPQSPVRLSPT
jgi:tRNA pseudouridine(55) synthase